MKKQLTKRYVLSRLSYQADSGTFLHLPRTVRTRHDATWNTRYAGRPAGWIRDKQARYILITLDGQRYYAHHLVWAVETGRWPDQHIDHKNGDPSDNRITNLRLATQSQNNMNKRIPRHNKSGVKGVHYATHYGCYIAKIEKDGRTYHLGYFRSIEAGAAARASADKRFYGDFSYRKYRKT